MKVEKQYCAWCGEYLGTYAGTYGVPECCGNPVCMRRLRRIMEENDATAHDKACEDNFDRYR